MKYNSRNMTNVSGFSNKNLFILSKAAIGIAILSICLLIAGIPASASQSEPSTYDIVVYGGTSAGVIAAVKSARMGKTVIIIEPGNHLGGMTSSGLGRTDTGNKTAIGGIASEFYRRLYVFYHGGSMENPGAWLFEPHAAEDVFNRLAAESNIPVIFGERLDRESGVEMSSLRIISLTMESGMKVYGKIFIDATYEGDLMACSGISYRTGRESSDTYGETLNGVQINSAVHHNFKRPVDAYVIAGDPSSGLLPGISDGEPGTERSGDNRIQAYNFRMCLTNVADNRLPWTEPDGYDPLRYELLLRYFDAGINELPLHIPQGFPNGKTDVNNSGAFSSDNIGMNYLYPEGDYLTREAILREHELYQRGLMWTLSGNSRVPESIRNTVNEWGLSCDEFIDNDNWPYQLYIREARRMQSDYVMTEQNCQSARTAEDPVGMAAYQIDSHNVQRYVDSSGHAQNEGDVQVSVPMPFPVSYRSIIPAIGECENLIVPVCVSASHIAFGSIRMEPVFMILGESAGTAAVISIDTDTSVQDLFYPILREVLIKDEQILLLDSP